MSEAKSEHTDVVVEPEPSMMKRYYPAAVPVILGLIIFFLPVPDGVDPKGMQMLGIFVGTIVALILQPLPTGSVALVGLSIAMITQTETPSEALAGFSNTTIWLIVASFFIAEGFLVTGLGKRIALMFVTKLGKSSLGLSYGMALTDLILAPATPSNTARAGGVVYPIIVSLSKLEDSNPEPEESRKKLGAYLLLTSLQVNVVTSAMFITAMAGNPVAVDAAAKLGIEISWGKWALAASVPGIASLIAIPWVMSKIFPPTMLKTPQSSGAGQGRATQGRSREPRREDHGRNVHSAACALVPGYTTQRQRHHHGVCRHRDPPGHEGAQLEQPGDG
ncbi:Inner membrane protein ybhI [Rhodococcus sp. AD45]|nr:Inner membrane protein ybhI [Rhodococcus sp. AD45]